MPVTQWIRWQCAFATSKKALRMGWSSVALFPHFISWAKLQGYDPDEGLDNDDLDPVVLSRALFGTPEDVTVSAVTDWRSVGLLTASGGRYFIHNYRKWQPDPTVTERVRRHREKMKRDETVTSVCNADGTGPDGTVREEKKREKEKTPRPPSGGTRTSFDELTPEEQYQKGLKMVDDNVPGSVQYVRQAAKGGQRWAARVCGARGLK